jgi:alpha-L-arabinofuranosidase
MDRVPLPRLSHWRFGRGPQRRRPIHTENGVYRQKNESVAWSYFGDAGWKDVTVSLKARKLHGREGFVIVVGTADGRRIEWNVGGFENRLYAVEADDEVIGTPVKASVEPQRWYEMKVEVRGRTVRCYLDGKLISDVTLPRVETVLAVAGEDAKTGEIVIKALNTGSEHASINLAIEGAKQVGTEGRLIRLSSSSASDENSFEEPRKIVPRVTLVGSLRPRFNADLPPWSFSMFRVQAAAPLNPADALQ